MIEIRLEIGNGKRLIGFLIEDLLEKEVILRKTRSMSENTLSKNIRQKSYLL